MLSWKAVMAVAPRSTSRTRGPRAASRRSSLTSVPVSVTTSGAPLLLLKASLGLEFDPVAGEIRLCDPRLPSFLDSVMLRNLRLGDCSVDLVARRHGKSVSVEVLRTEGGVGVSVVYGRLALT